MSFINNSKPNLDGSKYESHVEYEDKVSFGVDTHGPTYNSSRTRQLLRKMDINIVPFLALLYLLVVVLALLLLVANKVADYLSSTVPTLEMRVLRAWKPI